MVRSSSQKEPSESGGPQLAALPPDPESDGPEAGMAGRLADFAQHAPLLGQLHGLSPAYAIRWLLWLLAMLGSLFGLCLVLIGTLAGLFLLGAAIPPAQSALGDAALGVDSAAAGVDSAIPLGSALANASDSTARSFSNLSAGLDSMGTGLESLSAIPGIPSTSGSAASMHAAASNLAPAISSLQNAGRSAGDSSTRMAEMADSLRKVSSDLTAMRQSLGVSLFYAQVMVVASGLALAALLSGVFCLAVAYGPPKRN